MATDERLVEKFILPEERLTGLEMQPNFPFPIDTTIITAKDNWQFLRNLIRKSYDAVKDVFKATSLEYKIELYKEFMPTEEEDAMAFLRRNRQKQEKYEIEFEAGFKNLNGNEKRLWFYSFNYRNPDFRQLYEKLCKSIIRCNDLSFFKKEAVSHQKYGAITIFH